MDRGHFDAFTRMFSTQRSRRAALAAALSAVLLGREADVLTAARNTHKHKNRHQRQRRRRKNRSSTPLVPIVEACFAGANCVPGRGHTNSECDFSNSTVFVDLDARGAILDGANFSGADLARSDLRGAVLTAACFVGANLLGATVDNSTLLDETILCNTVMPDGSVNNSGCGRDSACCPSAPGGGGTCLEGHALCGVLIGTPCCVPAVCTPAVSVIVSSCRQPCDSDRDCIGSPFGGNCVQDLQYCPFLPGGRCCE